MNFIKETLNQVQPNNDTLYEVIYNLFFFAKLKESEDNIKNGQVCNLQELEQHIKELEANYENNHIH
jgi:hypothetical protein